MADTKEEERIRKMLMDEGKAEGSREEKKKMAQRMLEAGKLSVKEIAEYVKRQLGEEIWEEEQRFVNPHRHYMDMTPDYYDMKMSLLHDSREQRDR